MVKGLRKQVVTVGVIVIVIGLLLAVFGTRTYEVPYTEIETYEDQHSSIIADESRTISAYDYYAYYRDFDEGEKLKIEFSASRTVSIWLETETEYYRFENSESHSGVWAELDITSVESTITIPHDDTYYLVIFNESTSSSASYDLTVTEYWTTTETREVTRYRTEYDYTLNYIGVVILFAGVIMAIAGAFVKPSEIEEEEEEEETDLDIESLEIMEKVPSEIFCPSCGEQIEAGTTFCPHCGSQL